MFVRQPFVTPEHPLLQAGFLNKEKTSGGLSLGGEKKCSI